MRWGLTEVVLSCFARPSLISLMVYRTIRIHTWLLQRCWHRWGISRNSFETLIICALARLLSTVYPKKVQCNPVQFLVPIWEVWHSKPVYVIYFGTVLAIVSTDLFYYYVLSNCFWLMVTLAFMTYMKCAGSHLPLPPSRVKCET